MRKGDRVLFVAPWSSYRTERGAVTSTIPYLEVLVDGQEKPFRVHDREVIPEHSCEVSMTGAE